MSLSVSVYRDGRFSHFLKLKLARKQVQRGRYRWRPGENAIEEIQFTLIARPAGFAGMPGNQCVWSPRPSGKFIVMQAKWGW